MTDRKFTPPTEFPAEYVTGDGRKVVHWANDYHHGSGGFWYHSRREADKNADFTRIAVIRREWVEGQPPQYFTEEV